ncbi:MAG: coproporphyrinogen III oxidase family protein [Bacteriovoracaceae bacterium]|nr:coproporphyrinogen III oxidase family protein [Bacteriovoracaceae bacterium]
MQTQVSSLYFHYPFCRHLCNYCDFFKTKPQDGAISQQGFYKHIYDSWEILQKLLQENSITLAPLKTLYFGGGTPSLWGEEGVNFLQSFFSEKKITLADQGEFTLEINPGDWNFSSFNKWKEFGINRFSMGLQSLNNHFLKVLDRDHDVQKAVETMSFLHQQDVNFSVDLMLGLPFSQGEIKRDVITELKNILKYDPDHLSVYILTTKAGYPHQSDLPSEDYIADEYLLVSDFLRSQGYNHYEVSNFSKPQKESRHNLEYWHSNSVLALGPSATGFLKLSAEKGLRYKWKIHEATLEEEILNEKELWTEKLYLALRTNDGIWFPDFFSEEKCKKLQKWILMQSERNCLEFCNDKYRLTNRGYLLLDHLIGELLGI